MHAYLASRPLGFDSLRDAVEWHVRSRTVRNAVSARASVPGLLVHRDEGKIAASAAAAAAAAAEAAAGGEEGEGMDIDEEPASSRPSASGKPWRWRTDLAKTQPFWEGWFSGLSKKFLTGRGGKMLLLAGTDRLDTELTIGQMQGTFFFFWAFPPSLWYCCC
jgi:protein phosphatase methylesterase 1